MDTPAEADFDDVVRLAADLFDVPIALISLVGSDRQFFKASTGLEICETDRDISFCQYPALSQEMLVVPDATEDSRFESNPLVVGSPHIRFYAGAPLTTSLGQTLGTLCIIDTKTRATFSDHNRHLLSSLAKIVVNQLERRRLNILTQGDRMTGLPNRARFIHEVDDALRTADGLTVFKIGLDQFKTVNGTLGMAAGDGVLVAAAERVSKLAGDGVFVARLGADEFGIILKGKDERVAIELADKVLESLSQPYYLGGSLCRIGASIGIVFCSEPTEAADVVLKHALLALQCAKRAGGRRFQIFRPQLAEEARERRRLEDDLQTACLQGQFELFYQPQVALGDGAIVGAEALLRWNHPERGLLTPAAFLSVLETSQSASEVGRWILQRACSFAAHKNNIGEPIRMGVNVFACHLEELHFVDDVLSALRTSGLPSHLLELEITETTVLSVGNGTVESLRRLRNAGVHLALDDYGTGYASLSSLKAFPLTRLKIDREFVRDIRSDPGDAAIVKAVMALGDSLGLDVIAEGVETREQAAALAEFGCQQAQGYLFGKPMPEHRFEALRFHRQCTRRAAS